MRFSDDPARAEREMHAVLFYLATFGYIDGDFDDDERNYVKVSIRRLVSARADQALGAEADPRLRDELVTRYTAHFEEVFHAIEANVRELFTEAAPREEDPNAYVHGTLKLRCFEIFHAFDREGQEWLLAAIDELMMADGQAHPAETQFRAELAAQLHAEVDLVLEAEGPARDVRVGPTITMAARGDDHAFFAPAELHYASDPRKLAEQAAADRALLERASALLREMREAGQGRLAGKRSVAEFAPGTKLLDGHTYVMRSKKGRAYELLVLGDLHGCYSVLKAALMQSRFFEKVDAFRAAPDRHPEPKLVLLGDYIDRGIYGLNGVLRTALQLFVTAPEHVIVLRGNHEYFVEVGAQIYGGVRPSDAIDTLKPHLPVDVFRHYLRFFDELPNVLIFDGMFFVHAGIPRDRALKERWKDLSSLNDPELRFQMMWSDPSSSDVVPAELQDKSSRFAFGRLQARAFLQRVGCHTLIRGHEKVPGGFARTYDDEQVLLVTLFSAGGKDNKDLPVSSSYRDVTPMALTVKIDASGTEMSPWAPDYAAYNDARTNAFFAKPGSLRPPP